jgi:predicted regulator of Ras-like GTPase activity (Roadblock/LC7/MglB family)
MVTRQSELHKALGKLAADLPQADWVALVDYDGLIVACVPPEPAVEAERISAMTAAAVMMGERVLKEIDGGTLRIASISGSRRQQITVALGKDRLLTIGMGPEAAVQSTYGPVSKWVPELIRILRMRIKASDSG